MYDQLQCWLRYPAATFLNRTRNVEKFQSQHGFQKKKSLYCHFTSTSNRESRCQSYSSTELFRKDYSEEFFLLGLVHQYKYKYIRSENGLSMCNSRWGSWVLNSIIFCQCAADNWLIDPSRIGQPIDKQKAENLQKRSQNYCHYCIVSQRIFQQRRRWYRFITSTSENIPSFGHNNTSININYKDQSIGDIRRAFVSRQTHCGSWSYVILKNTAYRGSL